MLKQNLSGDFLLTSCWTLLTSCLAEVIPVAERVLGLRTPTTAALLTVILIVGVCDPVARYLGGANLNPTTNLAFLFSARGSVGFHVKQIVAQTLGAVLGVYLSVAVVPASLQGKFSLNLPRRPGGVPLLHGMACEFFLSFGLNLFVLLSMTPARPEGAGEGARKPKSGQRGANGKPSPSPSPQLSPPSKASPVIPSWIPVLSTFLWLEVGASSGPSMNPAIAFGWQSLLKGHSAAEHLLVYWVMPLCGGAAAGVALYAWAAVSERLAAQGAKAKAAKAD